MTTEKNDILALLKEKARIVSSDINEKDITMTASLKDLGLNSIDRAEIIMLILESLEIKAPMADFAQAKNVGELCHLFEEKCKSD